MADYRNELVEWVAERWHSEVSQRPLINVHRRSLDGAWRQMLRHLGEDDVALLGPRHDDLIAGQKVWLPNESDLTKECDELRAQLAAANLANAELRQIVSDCASAIGNGAFCAPTCSLEFMANVPKEIAAHEAELMRERREAVSAMFDAKAQRDAFEADARRYRLLRVQSWFDGPLCVLRDPKMVLTSGKPGLGADCPSHERLDEAIDAIDAELAKGVGL